MNAGGLVAVHESKRDEQSRIGKKHLETIVISMNRDSTHSHKFKSFYGYTHKKYENFRCICGYILQ